MPSTATVSDGRASTKSSANVAQRRQRRCERSTPYQRSATDSMRSRSRRSLAKSSIMSSVDTQYATTGVVARTVSWYSCQCTRAVTRSATPTAWERRERARWRRALAACRDERRGREGERRMFGHARSWRAD
eukprot:2121723-Rhodomonas_salina.2